MDEYNKKRTFDGEEGFDRTIVDVFDLFRGLARFLGSIRRQQGARLRISSLGKGETKFSKDCKDGIQDHHTLAGLPVYFVPAIFSPLGLALEREWTQLLAK